ncbi:MAG: YdcF family protein [Clostridiales bacterium]|nr:YdcF family protein [Clostridiales bacterium]
MIQYFLISIGALAIVYGASMVFLMNFNAGIIFIWLMGLAFVFAGAFYKKFRKAKWLAAAAAVMLVSAAALTAFIAEYALHDNADQREDAVIVLGAGINGDTVSSQLACRLDVAADYCKANTNAVIVVSGGQGAQETITEALAMERYLISKGISAERIIREETSVSSRTNLVNSKKILDDYFDTDYKTLLITSDYHVYRAMRIAQEIGLNCNHLYAETQWYELPARYLRECAAVLKLWIIGI